jgi:1-deoxy-D-xylulose-5-phosphate synthase
MPARVTDFAKADKKIVAITGAMPGGTGLSVFKKEIPERYFDVGIAEEHAALFACGMATSGVKPFLTIYSTFMQRAFDMIVHDMACKTSPCASAWTVAASAATTAPRTTAFSTSPTFAACPASSTCSRATRTSSSICSGPWRTTTKAPSPSATRVATAPASRRRTSPCSSKSARPKSSPMAATSPSSPSATCSPWPRPRRKQLEAKGLSVALINPRWIKPLDGACIESYAKKVKVVCTLEDHVLRNGFGCGVIEHLSDAGIRTPVVRIGWPDEFVEHGTIPILRTKHGLTAENCVAKVLAALGR